MVDTNWREASIIALEEQVRAIDDWLDHNADLIEMFEGYKVMLHELNVAAARVREAKNSLLDSIKEQKIKADERAKQIA